MILRRSFLKLLALPVVAPVVAMLPKRWVRVTVDTDCGDSANYLRYEDGNPSWLYCQRTIEPRYKVRQSLGVSLVPDDKPTIDFLLKHFGEAPK